MNKIALLKISLQMIGQLKGLEIKFYLPNVPGSFQRYVCLGFQMR